MNLSKGSSKCLKIFVAEFKRVLECAQFAKEVPVCYLQVGQWMKESVSPLRSWSELESYFPQFSKPQLLAAVEFLFDMGTCLFRGDVIVTDVRWFSGMLDKIQESVNEEGLLKPQSAFPGAKSVDLDRIAETLKKFELGFVERVDVWIIPSSIKKSRKVLSSRRKTVLHERVFQLDYIPCDIFGRMVVRMMSHASKVTEIWNNGLSIQQGQEEAVFEIGDNTVSIRVSCTDQKAVRGQHALIQSTTEEFISLLRFAYPDLYYQQFVTCPVCLIDGSEKKTLLPIEDCCGWILQDEAYFMCQDKKAPTALLDADVVLRYVRA